MNIRKVPVAHLEHITILKEVEVKTGENAAKLCAKYRWPPGSYSRARNGKQPIPLKWLPDIAEILGTNAWLLEKRLFINISANDEVTLVTMEDLQLMLKIVEAAEMPMRLSILLQICAERKSKK